MLTVVFHLLEDVLIRLQSGHQVLVVAMLVPTSSSAVRLCLSYEALLAGLTPPSGIPWLALEPTMGSAIKCSVVCVYRVSIGSVLYADMYYVTIQVIFSDLLFYG